MSHSLTLSKPIGKMYCQRCKLIMLNNSATQQASCNNAKVVKYEAKLKRYDDYMKKLGVKR